MFEPLTIDEGSLLSMTDGRALYAALQTADQAKTNDLMMVLDYNEDRSLELPLMNEQTSDWHNTMTMNLDPARSIKTPKSSLKLSQISKAMVEQPIRWQQ